MSASHLQGGHEHQSEAKQSKFLPSRFQLSQGGSTSSLLPSLTSLEILQLTWASKFLLMWFGLFIYQITIVMIWNDVIFCEQISCRFWYLFWCKRLRLVRPVIILTSILDADLNLDYLYNLDLLNSSICVILVVLWCRCIESPKIII